MIVIAADVVFTNTPCPADAVKLLVLTACHDVPPPMYVLTLEAATFLLVPPAPSSTIGDEVSIVDYAGTFDSNACTIAANGSEKIFGSTDDLTVSTERAAFTLVFTDSTQGWLFNND